MQLTAILGGVRVIGFGLLPRLRVTRVTYKDKEISYIQESRKEDGSFYVIMPEPLASGKSYSIGIEYEGDKVVEKSRRGKLFGRSAHQLVSQPECIRRPRDL